MSTASRRARRRAKARMRDLYQHGTSDRTIAPRPLGRPLATTARTFREALPDVPSKRGKCTVQVHEIVVLQTLTARGTGRYTRRKRTFRYRAVALWRGGRLAPKP